MWTPPIMGIYSQWIQVLEAWACWQLQIKTKELGNVEIRVEEVVDLGFEIKDSLLPNVVLGGGDSLIVQCCLSERHH